MKRFITAGLGVLLTGQIAASPLPLRLLDLDHRIVDPLQAPGVKAIVFLFTTTDCPISNRYAPEVHRLAETFGPQGVEVRLIYPDAASQAPAIREHIAASAYKGATEALRDPKHALVTRRRRTSRPPTRQRAANRRLGEPAYNG